MKTRILSILLLSLPIAAGVFLLEGSLPFTQRNLASLHSQPSPQKKVRLKSLCEHFYETVCQKKSITTDPTGTVLTDEEGIQKAMSELSEITEIDAGDLTRDQIHDLWSTRIYTPKRIRPINSAFRWVSRHLIRFIDRQPHQIFSAKEKTELKKRIRQVKLDLPPPPELFSKSEIIYEKDDHGQPVLRIGGGYVMATQSWFNLIFTLGHELGHAIDPCEIRQFQTRFSIPAYDRLSACFVKEGLIELHSNRRECIKNDQLAETFADWLGTQMVSEALTQYATEFPPEALEHAIINSVRDLCDTDEEINNLDLTFHPPPNVRMEKIFFDHPVVTNLLGCSPRKVESPYCSF